MNPKSEQGWGVAGDGRGEQALINLEWNHGTCIVGSYPYL